MLLNRKSYGIGQNRQRLMYVVMFLLLAVVPRTVIGQVLGSADIRVLGMQVDADTRPDMVGFQNTMTAVKNIPSAVETFVGTPGEKILPVFPSGTVVKAELSGSGVNRTLSASPNSPMELPRLTTPGDYVLSDIRLEDKDGNRILERDRRLSPVVITVIDKLLVTQVTSRPLTLEEIREKGIVIGKDNFTAMNFSVGLTLGSEPVTIEMPVLIPKNSTGIAQIPQPSATFQFEPGRSLEKISIPNLSLVGFSMRVPEEMEEKQLNIPPINGVIIIPGNIAFLNQFFSVILQASNAAPDGSGLNLEKAAAAIVLPVGDDKMGGTGDDPLVPPEVQGQGQLKNLKLTDLRGSDTIVPQGTNKAEFFVEGKKEGTHTVTFDITGDLYVPSLGKTVPMVGRAAGTVQVRNPSFSLTLAHPDVVREGEKYSVYATVTNASSVPANLFQLRLSTRSLSGAKLADDESDLKTADMLAPGQAETFEYRLIATTTGKVSGTVFLADPGINGSFILKTGVGDTGIPLSPDTLILPQTVNYLPKDLVSAAVRLLGQAYSVATAPDGTLPPDIQRMSRTYVFDRAVKLAQAGLHARFGEEKPATLEDILSDYLGNDLGRLEVLYPDAQQEAVRKDMAAFDNLRRKSDAGKNLSDVLGTLIGSETAGKSVSEVQNIWAERFASKPSHLSVGISSPDPVYLRITDKSGRVTGRIGDTEIRREIPYADRFVLRENTELIFAAAPESETYTAEAVFPQGVSGAEISMVVPDGVGMKQIRYPAVSVPAGATGKTVFIPGGSSDFRLAIDNDGDGVPDQYIDPLPVTPITDNPPTVIRAMQWAKGSSPLMKLDFATGDPLGRMVGVLFSEEVTKESAVNIADYSMPAHNIADIGFQPDRRMVFLMMNEPAGSLVARNLSVTGITDMRNNTLTGTSSSELAGDEDRGIAGVVSGIVTGPDGKPVPFAEIKYIQPVYWWNALEEGTDDFVISTISADAGGRYQIDFVLKNDSEADKPDIWLNQNHAGGTNNFKLEATDPVSGNIGKASTRIQYDGQRMALNVIIRGYGNIEGKIYDENGNIIVGGPPDTLSVYAKNISTGETYESWVDASGYYAFPRSDASSGKTVPKVAVGNVVLQIVGSGGLTGVATVNLPAAEVTVTQDIILVSPNRYGTVSGRVLENNGNGAANVLVQIAGQILTGISLYERKYSSGMVGSVYTDANGFFSCDKVPVGDIEVYASRKETYEQAQAKFRLSDDVSNLTLILPGTGGKISGTVKDAHGNIVAKAKVVAGPNLVETDDAGHFTISGLPLGRLTVFAQAPGSGAVGSVQISMSSENVENLVITLEPMGDISGIVYKYTMEEGEIQKVPVSSQKVQLWVGNSGIIAETYSDKDGRYSFRNVPVNSYSVRAVQADYGDGGMALTDIRYAGEERSGVDINFRGMVKNIIGQVVQDTGSGDTPVIADVIITRKVWRIITETTGTSGNYYLDYIRKIQEQTDSKTAAEIQDALDKTGATAAPPQFFMLVDEPVLVSSNILEHGVVTGKFEYKGPIACGPLTVTAFGPFLSPAEVKKDMNSCGAGMTVFDVGVIRLDPAVGRVTGTVFMPDGITPVGEGVKVTIRSLDNSGSVRLPENYGGSISQSPLPEVQVFTEENGTFEFPVVLKGRFVLTADTGTPPTPPGTAYDASNMRTDKFWESCTPDDPQCRNGRKRVLNIRLLGQTNGVVPAGEVLNTALRLNDAAEVFVEVVDHDGNAIHEAAEVTLKTASTLDDGLKNEEGGHLFLRYMTDQEGKIAFFPVIEGIFSVSAKKPNSPTAGLASGEVPVNPHNGHRIVVKVTLGAVTTDSGPEPAQFFGTVTGTVFKADGTPLKNPAQVTVRSAGISILTTSDENGRYTAEFVPGGIVQTEVFEPNTARRGTGTGQIVSEGQEISIPVTLIGLGTVNGTIFRADGSAVIPGADVILYPSGKFTDPLVSLSDKDGRYSLPGVPLGDYTVKADDSLTRLTGTAKDAMLREGDTRTTDVYLQPSGTIEGTVYDSDGTPAANLQIFVTGNNYKTGFYTDESGVFDPLPYLPLGTYTLTATGKDKYRNSGFSKTVTLSSEGQKQTVTAVLSGRGTVKGYVFGSGSDCVNNVRVPAEVTLCSRSPYNTYSSGCVIGYTAAVEGDITEEDGLFEFDNVPVGNLSVSVKFTEPGSNITLGTTVSGTLDGETLFFDGLSEDRKICLQDSGEITGTVLLPDGTTPAENAVVEFTSGTIRVFQITNGQGFFSSGRLPLRTYNISIHESVTKGVAGGEVTLNQNGQVENRNFILDNQAPSVVSVSPAAGATGIGTAEPITINFSEPIDPASVTAATFRVMADGSVIQGAFEISDKTVKFMPSALLPDLKQISVLIKGDKLGFENQIIGKGVGDMSGIGMKSDYSFVFSTADNTPPKLKSISPADGASGVNVSGNFNIRMEFSEPVNRFSITSCTLKASDGEEILMTMNSEPIFGDTVVVFMPRSPLSDNKKYTAELTGPVQDKAGNSMSGPIITTFSTTDTEPPVFDLTLNGSRIQGKTVTVTVMPHEPDDIAYAEFSIGNTLLSRVNKSPYVYSLYLKDAGSVEMKVSAWDISGNKSESTLSFEVAENKAPVIAITSPGGSIVKQGESVTVIADAGDDVGVKKVSLWAEAGNIGIIQKNQCTVGAEVCKAEFSVRIPDDYPAGTEIVLKAAATDILEVSAFAEVTLRVKDEIKPEVSVSGITEGAVSDPGNTVSVTVNAKDSGRISKISLKAAYENPAAPDIFEKSFDPAVSDASAEFGFTIPSNAEGKVTVTAEATDTFGNVGTRIVSLKISDKISPTVSSIEPSGTAVSAASSVIVTFSEGIRAETVNNGFKVKTADSGTEVGGKWVLTENNRKLTWIPLQGFGFGVTYHVVFTDNITDTSGNKLDPPQESSFTVTDFALILPPEPVMQNQNITLKAGGTNPEGIRSVNYYLTEVLIGTGNHPAPFPSDWIVPGYDSDKTLTLSGEAVVGGTNMALSAPASASDSSRYPFLPKKAVDGNTDGSFAGGSIAVISGTPPRWWEADIGRIALIDSISIHLNTSCCQANSSFAVLVAGGAFTDSDFIGSTLPQTYSNGTVEVYRTSGDYETGSVVTISTGPFIGRYVRVVHLGNEFLGMAEVEIREKERVVPIPESVSFTAVKQQ